MGSFRNRLLALIIGLVVVTQSVTLVAVLAHTERDVRAEAGTRLATGASIADQLMGFRATQLASAVDVLVADFGFRSAFASGDAETVLSAAENHSARIGADLMLLIDAQGRVLASSPPRIAGAPAVQELIADAASERGQARVALLGGKVYQLVVTRVRAPQPIGWAVMGFTVSDALAGRLRELLGAQVSLVARAHDGQTVLVASTLPQPLRSALLAGSGGALALTRSPAVQWLAGKPYLTYRHRLDGASDAVDIVLQQPLAEVLGSYYAERDAIVLIGGIALALAVAIGLLLGRSTARPIDELARAARRIQSGSYDSEVAAHGADEFVSLAETFNAMQRGIAEREARIVHDAYHDIPTDLPNRPGAERHLEQLLGRPSPPPLALIVVDLGNLREINASLGHHLGDDAMREAARRLRQNAAPRDLVARLAANQFLILLEDCTAERALLMAEQLVAVVRMPCHLRAVSVELHATAGVCCHPEHGATAAELLQRAQIALEDVDEVRGRSALYQSGRDEEHQRRLTLAAALRRALVADEMRLVYQPKVAMATRSVESLEALVRWTHPELGPISPGEFVPLIERTGGSRALTSWVLRAALRQMSQWRGEGLEIETAVNLSAPDILDPRLVEEILAELERSAIDPRCLVLEITESALMRDAPLAARHMQLLRASGVRFAIDDFGTGFSSLSQLSRLPVDELKIDRSFILRAHERRGDAAIVRSTIELAHSMGLKVVAEGVETAEGWNLLRRLRCDYAQGYLISKPLPASEVAGFVRRANELLADSESTMHQIRALTELARGNG